MSGQGAACKLSLSRVVRGDTDERPICRYPAFGCVVCSCCDRDRRPPDGETPSTPSRNSSTALLLPRPGTEARGGEKCVNVVVCPFCRTVHLRASRFSGILPESARQLGAGSVQSSGPREAASPTLRSHDSLAASEMSSSVRRTGERSGRQQSTGTNTKSSTGLQRPAAKQIGTRRFGDAFWLAISVATPRPTRKSPTVLENSCAGLASAPGGRGQGSRRVQASSRGGCQSMARTSRGCASATTASLNRKSQGAVPRDRELPKVGERE